MDTVEYIELFWDCPECGQAHISAVFNPQGNRCPSCLYWRVESIGLYEAPDSQVVTDPKLINRPPFWVCKVCDAVNTDTGLAAKLLQCENCNSYQTSEVGAISGNQVPDQQAPPIVAVGTPVKLQKSSPQPSPRRPDRLVDRVIVAVGVSTVAVMGAGILAGTIWSASIPQSPIPVTIAPTESTLLQVQVTDLSWVAEVDIEEQKGYKRESWQSAMPSGATLLKTETRENRRLYRSRRILRKTCAGTDFRI